MYEVANLPRTLQPDPRLVLDERSLAVASRNGFPIVATHVARRDGMGLALGGAVAVLLGGATFWSMSGSRTLPVKVPVPVSEPQYRERLPTPKPAPFVTPPTPSPVLAPVTHPATAVSTAPDAAHAPVMVLDTSVGLSPTPAARPVEGKPRAAPTQLSDNEAFSARIGDAGVETASATVLANPATTVVQGTLIAAVLETAIDSDLPGYARAVVSEDVRSFDRSHILVPRSSRLIGQYKSGLAAGQTRAYVMWTRLIRPDGVSVSLASPATDFGGRSGLPGDVNSHFMKRFGSAILLTVVGAATAVGNAAVILSGSQSAASVAAQRDGQIPPTIRVRQGQPIRIFTARDLDFSTIDGTSS